MSSSYCTIEFDDGDLWVSMDVTVFHAGRDPKPGNDRRKSTTKLN
jgi:hypothetical protein